MALYVDGGSPGLPPTVRQLQSMQAAIDFIAGSWWRRTLIRWISGGRARFESEG